MGAKYSKRRARVNEVFWKKKIALRVISGREDIPSDTLAASLVYPGAFVPRLRRPV